MSGVRSFRREDVPLVAALRQRSFAHSAHPSAAASEAYFHRVFFESPWHDPELPSLVYEDSAGRIVGFIGRITRQMSLAGETLRAAVATQLCVEPGGPQIAALNLLTRLFGGPQDLTWSDAATDRVRLLWCRLGGDVARLQSLHWTLPIRPSRVALAGVIGGHTTRAMRFACRLMLRDADSKVEKRAVEDSLSLSSQSPADLAMLVSEHRKHAGTSLTSTDSAETLGWLIQQAQEKLLTASLRSVIVRNANGSATGWYLYFALESGVADVVLMEAKPGTYRGVLAHLVRDALDNGLHSVRGRLEPELLEGLGELPCRLNPKAPWALFHSTRREVTEAVHSGRTCISRLDGEWWLNF